MHQKPRKVKKNPQQIVEDVDEDDMDEEYNYNCEIWRMINE